jgi:uncharacterized membrane protein YeiB
MVTRRYWVSMFVFLFVFVTVFADRRHSVGDFVFAIVCITLGMAGAHVWLRYHASRRG